MLLVLGQNQGQNILFREENCPSKWGGGGVGHLLLCTILERSL